MTARTSSCIAWREADKQVDPAESPRTMDFFRMGPVSDSRVRPRSLSLTCLTRLTPDESEARDSSGERLSKRRDSGTRSDTVTDTSNRPLLPLRRQRSSLGLSDNDAWIAFTPDSLDSPDLRSSPASSSESVSLLQLNAVVEEWRSDQYFCATAKEGKHGLYARVWACIKRIFPRCEKDVLYHGRAAAGGLQCQGAGVHLGQGTVRSSKNVTSRGQLAFARPA